jgi:crotonobetaine/carnitine-CoA ligase
MSTPDGLTARARTVGTALGERAGREPGVPFLKIEGTWYGAAELDERAAAVAGGLAALGVAKGDRVAVILPNRVEMVEVFFACAQLGAVLVPLNAWLKGEFLAHQLVDCQARVLVADAAGLESAIPIIDRSVVSQVVTVGTEPPELSLPATDWAQLGKLGDRVEVHVAPTDPMAIIYTSGTTGLPKGCVLSHEYYTSTSRVIAERGWLQPGDRLLTAWPLFHTSGQAIALMSALMIGASVAFETAFSASTFLAIAAADEATVVAGVGFMGAAILAQPTATTDREHRIRQAWWVPMPPDQQLAFEERFGVTVLSEAYGQTECFPVTMAPATPDRVRGTLGPPTEHFEVGLLDDEDNEVGAGEVGEICVRPRHPQVMFSGYWNRPEESLASWRNLWHHTGDLARRDADGSLRFVDRKKDAVRRRGENVSSLELEAAIRRHPGIKDVAVCAARASLGEDDIRATVVAVPGAVLEPTELFAFFTSSLPYFAIPRYVEVVPQLPVNALGRVMKHVIRDREFSADGWDFESLGFAVSHAERRG